MKFQLFWSGKYCQGCHRPHGMVGSLRLKEINELLREARETRALVC